MRSRRDAPNIREQLTSEWFPEERAFFRDKAQLGAAICGRRAGKTRGLVRDLLCDALEIPGFRGLYINSTRPEARKLAWHGNRGDGIKSLIEKMGIDAVLNETELSVHIPKTDAWIWLRGADKENELRKALGGAYHKVYYDEAQKIPPKLSATIKDVFLPALLDFEGVFRMTGTATEQMSGLFYDVTRSEEDQRTPGWSVHAWNLLANPFFGETYQERWDRGIVGLQNLLGGPDACPLDSPRMLREGMGQWTREGARYVYHVHKIDRSRLFYAPTRWRDDGFPDIPKALGDLPWNWKEAQFALGADIGYSPDPFAMVLWGWHGRDPKLYEVMSWSKKELDSEDQSAAIRAVREHVAIGVIAADAGGSAKGTVKGWSKDFVTRYGLPILEAEKHNKHDAISMWNGDIVRGNIQLRDGGPLYAEMSNLQWAHTVSAMGRLIEDPSMDNHCCDGGLYGHRMCYQYRWRPPVEQPKNQNEKWAREAKMIEEDLLS